MQKSKLVALRKESVDRNLAWCLDCPSANMVALRKESVDRNILRDRRHWQTGVALRKESVDRNRSNGAAKVQDLWSLSARRAWIEITQMCCPALK